MLSYYYWGNIILSIFEFIFYSVIRFAGEFSVIKSTWICLFVLLAKVHSSLKRFSLAPPGGERVF